MIRWKKNEIISYRFSRWEKWNTIKEDIKYIDISQLTSPVLYINYQDTPMYLFDLIKEKETPSTLTYEEEKNGKIEFSSWLQTWFGVYPNQHKAAQMICHQLIQEKKKEIVLIALTQSGKTGCLKTLYHSLFHVSSNRQTMMKYSIQPTNVYYICGMNDYDLRNQLIQDMKSISYPRISCLSPQQILFNPQLQQWNKNSFSVTDETRPRLLFVDESHYASFQGSHVDQFIQRWKSQNSKDQPIYIIYISATPFSEMSYAIRHSNQVAVVYLTPGPNYYSVMDIMKEGLLFQACHLQTQKGRERLLDIIEEEYELQQSLQEPRYCIIRLSSLLEYKDIEDYIQQNLGLELDFINYHSQPDQYEDIESLYDNQSTNHLQDINQIIQNQPAKMTIIWIYNSLRAGKQLNTNWIGFVHDTPSSLTDVAVQGLLGRITGYGKGGNQVKCYTNLSAAQEMVRWIQSGYDTYAFPQGTKYIRLTKNLRTYQKTNNGFWTWNVPRMHCLNLFEQGYYKNCKEEHRHRYPYKDELIHDILVSSNDRILHSILQTHQPGKCGGLMILDHRNKETSLKKHWKPIYQAWKTGRPIGGYGGHNSLLGTNTMSTQSSKFFYIYLNLHPAYYQTEQYGMVLLTYGMYKTHPKETKEDEISSQSMIRLHPHSRYCR